MSLQNEIVSDNVGVNTENVSNQVDTISEIPTEKVTFRTRGPDRKPRRFNPKSLHNLKQYQSTSTFNSGMVYQPSRINIPNIVLVIVIGLVLGFVVWKIIDRFRAQNEENQSE